MAQGTGAKRFLTKFAKTAGAGALLALAVLAFVLSGCGGSSSDSSSSTIASTSGGGGGGASGVDPSAHPVQNKAGADSSGTSAGSADSPSGGSASGNGKHGPRVPQPKGEEEPGITPQQRREASVADLTLESPSSAPSTNGPQTLSAQYTCDGKNISPALRWKGVPAGTAELVLFTMNTKPVDGTLFFDWAVAGLSPDLEGLEAGELPKGAVVGRNGFGKTGYEICPAGSGETYLFSLFALPKKLSPEQGFEPLALRTSVVGASGDVGLIALGYKRG